MNRLTRDGTGRPNLSRETKFSGVNEDKEIFPWSAGHVNRIGNLPVDLYSAICYSYGNNKTCQYSSSSTNIFNLNILYIVVGVGKIWMPPWTSGAIP